MENLQLHSVQGHSFFGLKKPVKNVPSLSQICVELVARQNQVVDTLFDIYGPETNFPIPNHLVERIQKEERSLGCAQGWKLALLLINSHSTSCRPLHVGSPEDVGKWQPLVWQKLSTLAADKLVKFEDDADYTSDFDWFSHIDVALPHLARFKNLQVLSMSGTDFTDKHFEELPRKVPGLRSLTFQFNHDISFVGIEAMAELEKLEEIFYAFNFETCDDCDAMITIQEIFTSACLGAMPKLKIAGGVVDEEAAGNCAIPAYDEPTKLALEHMKVMIRLEKACQNSSLPNVRFFRISYIRETEHAREILSLGVENLECLYVVECFAESAILLISAFGHSLTKVDLMNLVGAVDFLEIIDLCPNLKELSVCRMQNGPEDFKDSSHYSTKPPMHLEVVFVTNEQRVQLPTGAIVRLCKAPKLRCLTLVEFDLSEEDCLELISHLKASGACKVLEKFCYDYSGPLAHEMLPTLVCSIAMFCPRIKKIDYTGRNGSNALMNVCSELLKGYIDFHSSVDEPT